MYFIAAIQFSVTHEGFNNMEFKSAIRKKLQQLLVKFDLANVLLDGLTCNLQVVTLI